MLELDFINRRTRFQRLSDARFFSGWATEIAGAELTVHLSAPATLHRDDICMFEVYGVKATANFRGRLSTFADRTATFRMELPIRYLPAQPEDTRLNLRGITGKALWEGVEVAFEVVDGSEHGIGLISDAKLSRGDQVQLVLQTGYGQLVCNGEVRYSRVAEGDGGRFRTGVRLDEMSRVERARWERLLADAQAPSKAENRMAG